MLGFGAVFASIPLFASMENLQPPWPEPVAYISAALILVGMLIAREFGEEMSRRRRRILLLSAALLTVVGLFGYLYLYLEVVLPLGNGERLVLGFSCNAEAQSLYGARCPYLTEEELAAAGYEPDLLYPRSSLLMAKLALVAAWMLFTAGLVAAVGWAVIGRSDETPPPPAQPEQPG